MSFSPLTFTHFPLTHCVSFEQKQPPGPVHGLDVPLQLPNGHVKRVPTELGHPPSGHGTPESGDHPVPPSAPVHVPCVHICPSAHAAPQAPQLAGSTM
jgi:hypothetical protein